MPTLLTLLTELETLARLIGPSVEPIVLAQLDRLKAAATRPIEIALIDAAEALITSYFPQKPAAA
jgi:hypothetical protein